MIELRKITHDNFHAILNLELTVEQKSLVEPNSYRLANAFVNLTNNENPPMLFAIYYQEDLIGFVDTGYYQLGEKSFLTTNFGDKTTYGINSFIIDKKHQGKGLGREALLTVLDFLQSFPQGKADAISISYWMTNHAARRLYTSVGFVETGDVWDGDTFEKWDPNRQDIEYAEVGSRFAL
jgi:diamine N-acetyltransferase